MVNEREHAALAFIPEPWGAGGTGGGDFGRILEAAAGWEEQPITFTAMRGWLAGSAELQRQYKSSCGFILLSLLFSVRYECPELELEERLGALPLPSRGVMEAPTGGSEEKWGCFSIW